MGITSKETENGGMPIKVLTTDLGSEWMSDAFDDAIVEGQVYHFTAQEGDHHKMGMIERFNRTMKALLINISQLTTQKGNGLMSYQILYPIIITPFIVEFSAHPWKRNEIEILENKYVKPQHSKHLS